MTLTNTNINELTETVEGITSELGELAGDLARAGDVTDIEDSMASMKSTIGTLQTMLAITFIAAIISVVILFMRRS